MKDQLLSAMVNYGFLSYYNNMLSIPNRELQLKFDKALKVSAKGGNNKDVGSNIEERHKENERNNTKSARLQYKKRRTGRGRAGRLCISSIRQVPAGIHTGTKERLDARRCNKTDKRKKVLDDSKNENHKIKIENL